MVIKSIILINSLFDIEKTILLQRESVLKCEEENIKT